MSKYIILPEIIIRFQFSSFCQGIRPSRITILSEKKIEIEKVFYLKILRV